MKNNNLYSISNEYKTTKPLFINKNGLYSIVGFALVALFSQKGNAQSAKADSVFVNKEQIKVSKGTVVSVHMDYDNTAAGTFVNDGEVHIYQNWKNDGLVSFTPAENGKTFFTGKKEQMIEGVITPDNMVKSNFQNIRFETDSILVMPFRLETKISVNKKAEFVTGIVDGSFEDSKVIFNENATHSNTSDLSFVDGQVAKIGRSEFEFPVGNVVYRPDFRESGDGNDMYTSQYFFKDSDGTDYPHSSKDKTILEINTAEYWNITQNKEATEKIVLGLTLDSDTTPAQFFNTDPNKEVAIVRWEGDKKTGRWVNDHGTLGSEVFGEAYSNLLTGVVGGYGIFTIALVEKTNSIPPDVEIFNAMSPNDDGINDTFHIKGIANYPDNEVEIYNRWGVKVYDAKSYNESDNMFRGYSDGRATLKRGEKLPTGTYFYILKYKKGDKGVEKSGYLYINNQ